MLWIALACSAGTVDVDQIDDFGTVKSAWYFERLGVGRIVGFSSSGIEEYGASFFDATLRLSTMASGCAKERAYLAAWSEASVEFLARVEDDPDAGCAAYGDFLAALDDADVANFPDERNELGIFFCDADAETECSFEDGRYAIDADGEQGWRLASRLWYYTAQPRAEAWDASTCEMSPVASEGWDVAEGEVTLEVDQNAITVELDGSLVDFSDRGEEGTVAADAHAARCELEDPEVLVY